MSTATASTPKEILFQAATANEWGQITGLEPNAAYFVVRKPTKELTREKSEELVADLRAFVQQRREVTEKQVRELNDKYGSQARQKAHELREQLEKRFDELTKEFEQRVEKIEAELGERADRLFHKNKTDGAGASAQGETPGEMPRGDDAHAASSTTAATSTATVNTDASAETETKAGKKKGGKKSE